MKKNIIILVIPVLAYLFYFWNIISDTWMLIMMSGAFSGGLFSAIKAFQYLILNDKQKGEIIQVNSALDNGSQQASYSRGYNYKYLIEGIEYSMPKYFSFGSKYNVGDVVKVSIIDKEEKILMPIRAVFNIMIIAAALLYVSVTMATK